MLYGTALQGGASNNGTAFKVNTDGGGFTVLKNFNTSDGVGPIAGLSVVSNVLYGVTSGGGSAGNGTLFKLNPDGSDFTVLRNFITTDGISPNAGLTLSDGTLYGTTAAGGNSGGGTVFALGVGDSSGGGAHQITSHPLADGMIQLDFPGISGTNYILEQTHALNPPVMWIPVSTNTAGVDGELHFTNVVTSTNTFWRNPFLDVKKWWPARVMRPVPRIKSPLHHFNACRPKKDSTGGETEEAELRKDI
ncbi:MAG: choice-of-anchor tandem repeat GloVer-containing protein [Limisphaerales bacterium]